MQRRTFPHRFLPGVISFAAVLILAACAQNPVTGKKDFLLVSEAWELSVGRQQYAPLRQAQGGDYVVDPGVEQYVRKVGLRLAAKSDRKLPYEFNVINDSTPNAWALPGGKISINRGLLTELKSEAELAAVLGHEIVHAAAKHGARGQTRGMGLQLAVMTATIAGSRKGYGQLAQLGSSVGAQIISSKYGREAELEADRYGMEYMSRAGYDPEGAVGLQQTFVRLSEGRRQDFLSGLFASHPPSRNRVRENIKTAAELGESGEIGTARYKQAMSRLFSKKAAYDKFDQAQKLAADKKIKQAEALAREAARIEPREGHFQSFLGDIALQRKDLTRARRHYDQAISLNGDFFYYWLQRGKVHQAQRNARAAKSDFARSVKLMPTADAQAGLGAIALAAGNKAEATRWYQMAAQFNGAAGKQARTALNKLSPPRPAQAATRPAQQQSGSGGRVANVTSLVQVQRGVGRDGNLAFEVVNRTARPIDSVQLGVVFSQTGKQKTTNIRQLIPAGGRAVINTRQKITQAQLAQMRVKVLAANFAARR